MRNEKVFEIETAQNRVLFHLHEPDLDRELPDVPVLSETLLLMELMVGERAVDLTEVTHLILSDLGASLQIMRLAGREGLSGRMQDCISGLGVRACLDVISKKTIRRSACDPAIVEAWTHARKIAENCKFLAEEAFLPVSPDDAYLVGLFHAIAALPNVLGWTPTPQTTGNHDGVGLRLALAWSLPDSVVAYFSEIRPRAAEIRWKEMVRSAHHGANASRIDSSVCDQILLHDPAKLWGRAVSS